MCFTNFDTTDTTFLLPQLINSTLKSCFIYMAGKTATTKSNLNQTSFGNTIKKDSKEIHNTDSSSNPFAYSSLTKMISSQGMFFTHEIILEKMTIIIFPVHFNAMVLPVRLYSNLQKISKSLLLRNSRLLVPSRSEPTFNLDPPLYTTIN